MRLGEPIHADNEVVEFFLRLLIFLQCFLYTYHKFDKRMLNVKRGHVERTMGRRSSPVRYAPHISSPLHRVPALHAVPASRNALP